MVSVTIHLVERRRVLIEHLQQFCSDIVADTSELKGICDTFIW